MRGRNSSADTGPGLREQTFGLLPIQQFWPKALNPGGLEAEPPSEGKDSSSDLFKPPLFRLASAGRRAALELVAAVARARTAR